MEDRLITELRELIELLHTTGKEHMAARYQTVMEHNAHGIPCQELARQILDIGVEGKHCCYNYIEDKKIGNVLQLAQQYL